MTLLSATVVLLLVLDPIGNAVLSVSILEGIKQKRSVFIIRELLVALMILLVFLFFGRFILSLLQIKEPALSIAGGIVLFLISIKMIFPPKEGMWANEPTGEPFIVPLATPLIAGPSAIAVVLLMASKDPSRMLQWTLAIFVAWFITLVVLLLANVITLRLGKPLISGIQRLTGMILTAISVQIFLSALERYFPSLQP